MKQKTKIIIEAAAAVIAVCVILLCTLGGSRNGFKKASEALSESYGIKLESMEAYSGAFYEDGSDEEVSDVIKLTVKNIGSTDYRLVRLYLTDSSGREYCFEITTLLCGETVNVLEKNRGSYETMGKITDARAEDCAMFEEEPSTHPETLAYFVTGNSITVQNISDKDLGNISVFYKNYEDGVAVGGITYMLTIPTLAAGESVEIGTSHFAENTSKFVFTVYEEQG